MKGRAGPAASFLCGGRKRRGGIAAAAASAGTAGRCFAQCAISLVSCALCVVCVETETRVVVVLMLSLSKASSSEIRLESCSTESTDLDKCNPDLDTVINSISFICTMHLIKVCVMSLTSRG